MNKFERLIEFHSPNFTRTPEDRELVNHHNMHGYALSKYIGDKLEMRGTAVDYVPEDWGWYCFLVNLDFSLAYGVVAENDGEEFLIQFIPHKPFVRKGFFKKIDVSEPLLNLQENVFEILCEAPNSGQPKWIEG